MRAVKAGVVYFLLVFALEWILGPIRELWTVPHSGRVTATLLEAVIMLIAMVAAARWVIRQFEVPQTTAATTAIGLVALGVLIPAEIAGVVFVRGLSFQDYFSSFLTAPGMISLSMFLIFAAMPSLVTLLTRGRSGAIS